MILWLSHVQYRELFEDLKLAALNYQLQVVYFFKICSFIRDET